MKVSETAIPGVLIVEPRVFGDERGFFFESFNQREFASLTGWTGEFVQDNHSRSSRGVLRGMHYQIGQPQGKLLRVAQGAIADVVVDLRRSSGSFGRWLMVELDAASNRQLWIPPGFAHGFQVTSESADVLYKTTDYYAPEFERCLAWDDAEVGIKWPVMPPVLSAKDLAGASLSRAETYA